MNDDDEIFKADDEIFKAFQELGESFGRASMSVESFETTLTRRRWKAPSRKFRCAKCKDYFLNRFKALAPRRSGGPGVVSWCIGCVCNEVSTWEHPWRLDV